MKRPLILILALAFLICGCAAAPLEEPTEEDNGRYQLTVVYDGVKSMKPVLKEAQEIIDWQIENSVEDIEAAEEAIAQGEAYQAESDPAGEEEIRERYDQLLSLTEEVADAQKDIDKLETSGIAQVDMTVEAAREYFSRTAAALDDIKRIFDFYFAQLDAVAPMEEYDSESYGDDTLQSIDDLWVAVGEVCDNLRAVDCPEYMSQTFERQVDSLEQYRAILESEYYGVEYTDVLRTYSAVNMMQRINILVTKYDIQLSKDFNMQFTQAGERLSGSIATLGGEITANCEKLLAADWR